MLKELLSKYDGTKQMVEDCVNVVKNSDGIVIFGAGVGGAALYKILKQKQLDSKILAFSDNNELKFGKNYCEERIKIVNPNALVSMFGRCTTIIVASSAYDVIKSQLINCGIDSQKIYLFNFAFMDVEYTDCTFIYDHIDDFERAYSRLADEKSSRIFVNILNYKITKEIEYLEKLKIDVDDEKYQYFDDELFEFSSDETMLDIGAYTGDTFISFCDEYKEWKSYIGFEADPEIYKILETEVQTSGNMEKSLLFNYAAWNENTQLVFSDNPGSSTITNDGGTKVEAVVCDDILINRDITFIKMDIEGAEYQALCGLQNVIRQNKPIIAVCVYHLRDDFYNLPDLIERITPNEYTFYFRQYRYTPTETVCYAIPKKRNRNINI